MTCVAKWTTICRLVLWMPEYLLMSIAHTEALKVYIIYLDVGLEWLTTTY